jgi:hypothetical protein
MRKPARRRRAQGPRPLQCMRENVSPAPNSRGDRIPTRRSASSFRVPASGGEFDAAVSRARARARAGKAAVHLRPLGRFRLRLTPTPIGEAGSRTTLALRPPARFASRGGVLDSHGVARDDGSVPGASHRFLGVIVALGLLSGGGVVAVGAASGAGENATVQQYELTCNSGDTRFAYQSGSRAGLDANHNGFICGHSRTTSKGTVIVGPFYDDF